MELFFSLVSWDNLLVMYRVCVVELNVGWDSLTRGLRGGQQNSFEKHGVRPVMSRLDFQGRRYYKGTRWLESIEKADVLRAAPALSQG
jgi:hypothetical protein